MSRFYWLEGEELAAAERLGELFDMRTVNCLINQGILSLDELLKYHDSQILDWPNFGKTSLAKMKAALAKNGLALDDGSRGDEQLKNLLTAAEVTRKTSREASSAHSRALAAITDRKKELIAERVAGKQSTP